MKKIKVINFKIRSKLLLIYIFSVLLPIIATDAVILITVNNSSKEKQWKELQYVMERVEYNLRETIRGCILFTTNLYGDRTLDKFLNTTYPDYISYYDAYINLLNNDSLSYSYNNGILYKIQVFTDNDTILSGGHIAKVETIKDTDWYKDYKESGLDTYLHTQYDESRKRVAGGGTSRTISIIRNMDNFSNRSVEKFLKIDIDYNFMLKDVMNEKLDAKIYVRNQDHILFSNLPNENSMIEFQSADILDDMNITMKKILKAGNEEWEIDIVSDSIPFWSVLLENKYIWILIIVNLIFPSLLIYVVGRSITNRLDLVSKAMDHVKKENFDVVTTVEGEDEIGDLIRSYNLMVIKIKNLIEVVFKGKEEKQVLELSKKQAELKALQSQVNPHFLFNTLETIRMRSFIKGEEETANIISQLATLFRKSMDWRTDYSSIKEEVSFVEKYINIQRYRFGDKITFQTLIPEGCFGYFVPKLGIATFIENACIHGIEASAKSGIISLIIEEKDDDLVIEVVDNGRGFLESELLELKENLTYADNKLLYESKSTGMLNVYIRFQMFCEGNMKFDIQSKKEIGTCIRIEIPLSYAKGRA